MQSNDLKKGTYVRLTSGIEARIEDNRRGNVRLATVFAGDVGLYTEMGSIYAHDIDVVLDGRHGRMTALVQHTDKQKALRKQVVALGF